MLVALSAAVSVSVLAGCAGGSPSDTPTASDLSMRYTDRLGWSFRYPASMHLERSKLVSRLSIHEVTVANFEARRPIHTTSNAHGLSIGVEPPRPAHGSFPSDGIAFRVYQQEGGPGPYLEAPEVRLPLHIDDLKPSTAYASTRPRPLGKGISAAGRNYAVYAWIGHDASPHQRSAVQAVVQSLSFPHLREGTVAGYGFSVLGRAHRYPVGSFTPVRIQRQTFYLVHAPGGFYTVGCCWNTSFPIQSACGLRFDPVGKQFFCKSMPGRWDRIARPTGSDAGEDTLILAITKLSWDGHVLVYPGSARLGNRQLARQYWPAWSGR